MTHSHLTSDSVRRLASLGGLRRSDELTCYQLLRPHIHMFDIIGGCLQKPFLYVPVWRTADSEMGAKEIIRYVNTA